MIFLNMHSAHSAHIQYINIGLGNGMFSLKNIRFVIFTANFIRFKSSTFTNAWRDPKYSYTIDFFFLRMDKIVCVKP